MVTVAAWSTCGLAGAMLPDTVPVGTRNVTSCRMGVATALSLSASQMQNVYVPASYQVPVLRKVKLPLTDDPVIVSPLKLVNWPPVEPESLLADGAHGAPP